MNLQNPLPTRAPRRPRFDKQFSLNSGGLTGSAARLGMLALLAMIASPVFAQSGLISGRVVAVVDEGGQPMSEMPIIVGGDEIGVTGTDGLITLPIGTFDTGSSVTFATKDDKVFVNDEDEDDCEDNSNDPNADDDEGCIAIGVITWNNGGSLVTLGGSPTLGMYDTGGMAGSGYDDEMDDDMDDEDSDYFVEIGIGYNFDFGNSMISLRGVAEQPVESVPVGAAVGFDYILGVDNGSFVNFMIDVTYGIEVTEEIDAYVAGGLRFFRRKFSGFGFSRTSTETGFGLRGGAVYPAGVVDLFAELGLSFAYSSTLPELRAGARYGF